MTNKGTIKIGLALSGGGVRAAVFHLGVLARLAADELLENVTFISTVSGGSMVTGLVYGLAGNRWPSSANYAAFVLPEARRRLTRTSIQRDYILRLLRQPWLLLQGRAKLVSESMQHCWGMTGLVKDIPTEPRWIINATSYESGKNWRFMPQRMGDYVLNYVLNPAIPLADAVAASAAFPGLIGPLVLRSRSYSWFRYPETGGRQAFRTEPPPVPLLHLWDGGVYDNLGTEALYKPSGGLRDEFNFLVVSDASAGLTMKRSIVHQRPFRLINIATDQVRSLRARTLVDHFRRNPSSGVYLKIGGTARYILGQGGVLEAEAAAAVQACLGEDAAHAAAAEGTHLRRLPEPSFDRICRHGWEVADCTLRSRCPDLFRHRFWTRLN